MTEGDMEKKSGEKKMEESNRLQVQLEEKWRQHTAAQDGVE